jgi:hypothetical protein
MTFLRALILAAVMAASGPGGTGRAAGLAPEEAERLQRLSGLVEDLLASQASMQKRLSALTDQIHAVREEGSRAGDRLNDRFATREELRKLAESVRELDRKREEDKRLILEEIKKLAQTPVVVPRDTPKAPAREAAPSTPGKGYTYTIKKGDTISAVVAAYRANGVKVTVDEVIKANPHLKPNALAEGAEIFIPDPALK